MTLKIHHTDKVPARRLSNSRCKWWYNRWNVTISGRLTKHHHTVNNILILSPSIASLALFHLLVNRVELWLKNTKCNVLPWQKMWNFQHYPWWNHLSLPNNAKFECYCVILSHWIWVSPWIVYTGWYKKTGPVWALITLWRLLIERCVICQKFTNVVKKMGQTCIAKQLSIFCLLCINIRHPQNFAKFNCNAGIFNVDNLSFYNLATFTAGKACQVSKLCPKEA